MWNLVHKISHYDLLNSENPDHIIDYHRQALLRRVGGEILDNIMQAGSPVTVEWKLVTQDDIDGLALRFSWQLTRVQQVPVVQYTFQEPDYRFYKSDWQMIQYHLGKVIYYIGQQIKGIGRKRWWK